MVLSRDHQHSFTAEVVQEMFRLMTFHSTVTLIPLEILGSFCFILLATRETVAISLDFIIHNLTTEKVKGGANEATFHINRQPTLSTVL